MKALREAKACSGFVPSRGYRGHCIHGFPQSIACSPGRVTEYSPPHCVNEKWCGRMYPDGKPEPMPLSDEERVGVLAVGDESNG